MTGVHIRSREQLDALDDLLRQVSKAQLDVAAVPPPTRKALQTQLERITVGISERIRRNVTIEDEAWEPKQPEEETMEPVSTNLQREVKELESYVKTLAANVSELRESVPKRVAELQQLQLAKAFARIQEAVQQEKENAAGHKRKADACSQENIRSALKSAAKLSGKAAALRSSLALNTEQSTEVLRALEASNEPKSSVEKALEDEENNGANDPAKRSRRRIALSLRDRG